jgi:hypothetical protein
MRQMNPTRNGLSGTMRKAVIEVLNVRLAAALDLAAIAKQAHWKVEGRHVMSLWDEIEGREVALGCMVAGRTPDVAGASKLIYTLYTLRKAQITSQQLQTALQR